MYSDYPTIYETTIDQNLIYFIILGIILLILLIVIFISLAKIFKKANRSGIYAIIPVYNIIMLLEITNSSKWYLLFLLIPGINIIFGLPVMFALAKTFRKSKAFAIGLTFLPFIFYPILAFGKNEYIGINLAAMGGKSIATDIPRVMESEEKNPVVHEEKDTNLKNINISIGGGVYQKDYTNTLLEVDQKQAILNKNEPSLEDSTMQTDIKANTKSSFIPAIVELKKIEEPNDISTSFANQLNSITEQKEPLVTSQPQMNKISIDNPQPINRQPSVIATPEIKSIFDNNLHKNSEFISCPKCGAKIKSDAKVCFLCGRKLD